MKILIANKFFYPRGGDCISTINLYELLKSKGNEVAIFSMNYSENNSTEWDKYFAQEVSFSVGGIKGKLLAIKRIFGGAGVKKQFIKLLDDFQPDVIHLQNIHSYLSPILAKIAHKRNIKVIWTLHDYKLICPAYSCLRNGKTCELCFKDKTQVIRKKCMKGSLIASVLAYAEIKYWNKKKLIKYTDTFICPSQFMFNKMAANKFPKEKLFVISNFIEQSKLILLEKYKHENKKLSYCYVGRLSEEKGISELLKTASKLPYTLFVAGTGPLFDSLKQQYESSTIHFLGHISSEEVVKLISSVHFLVMPSVCYENNPLSVIESLCLGTPVLGAEIGGIPELLSFSDAVKLGISYTYNDAEELKKGIETMFNSEFDNMRISELATNTFSEDFYYKKIMKVYNESIHVI